MHFLSRVVGTIFSVTPMTAIVMVISLIVEALIFVGLWFSRGLSLAILFGIISLILMTAITRRVIFIENLKEESPTKKTKTVIWSRPAALTIIGWAIGVFIFIGTWRFCDLQLAFTFGGAALLVFFVNLARKRAAATTKPVVKLSVGRRIIDIAVRILIVLLIQAFMCEKMVPNFFYDTVRLVVIIAVSLIEKICGTESSVAVQEGHLSAESVANWLHQNSYSPLVAAFVLGAVLGLLHWRWYWERLATCPSCRAKINPEATVCRHCHSAISPVSSPIR